LAKLLFLELLSSGAGFFGIYRVSDDGLQEFCCIVIMALKSRRYWGTGYV